MVERWEAQRSSRGRPAHPERAYLKAFLLRIREGMVYTTQLRRFLLRHPLLVIELGFRLVLDPSAPYGFDVEQTLPCEFWLREKLRHFDPALLQALLQATVRALQDEIPGLGETVAFDVKHIYGWVKENNERAYVPERYDKTKRLAGDPDCRLGVKRSTNQETADAAYDAWYVYEAAARQSGIAAVPLNQHSKTPFARLADGTPCCPIGLPMHPTLQFNHTYGYRAQRFQCPLLFPEQTGATCAHEQFVKGRGCVKDVNWELGGIQRVTLNRDAPLFHVLYNQRTGCERVNARAKELGIERPKVRNGRSVAHLNTLIYVIVNVRV